MVGVSLVRLVVNCLEGGLDNMAKLSEAQKNNLKAKWETGQYTKTELAKAYKISDVMVGKIVGRDEPKNSDIVEASLLIEKAKKFEKSSAEISAIEQAVKYRLQKEFNADNNKIKVFDTASKILQKVNDLLDKGKKQSVTTANLGDGIVEANIIETDLQSVDYKNAIDTVDKVAVVMEVAPRHANQQINVNTQTNVNNNKIVLSREEMEVELKKRGLPIDL